ncbi:MAG: ribosome recycling factor [Actinomycetota bacterium]
MSELVEALHLEADEKMNKAVEHAQSEFATIRTGRASPALLERIMVSYYGADVPLQQLASFSVPEARLLVVSPFDKGSMDAIEKAIRDSNLGMNPSNDGNVLRLAFPPLTEERRKELVRVVKNMAEDGRIAVRNARRAARSDLIDLEKDGDISADDLDWAEKELDKLTQQHVEQIDQQLEAKERELLEI